MPHPVNLLHIFRTPFYKNTYGGLYLVLTVVLNEYYPAGTLLFKVNKKDNKTTSLTSFWCLFLNFEQISRCHLLFPLLTLKNQFSVLRNQLSFDFILCTSLQYLSEKIFVKFFGDIFFLLKDTTLMHI